MTDLVQRIQATFNKVVVFIDAVLEARDESFVLQPITIPISASFEAANDRIYDVRGFLGFFAQIDNRDGSSVDIDYLIQKTTTHFENLTDIQSTDWLEEVAEVQVNAGELSVLYETVRATPMITAIRLRIKTALNSGNPGLINGTISAN